MSSVAELRNLFLFAGLDDAQLGELLAGGDEMTFADGDVLFAEGEPAESWWVLLEGRIELVRRSERDETVVGALERPGVWAGGFRAWTESAGYMATGRCAGSGRVLRVPAATLHDLVESWFPFGVHLIEGFFQTVRNMEAQARQRAGLISLGTIAAGLAHEINNPAAASTRAAAALQESSGELIQSLVDLAQGSLSGAGFMEIDALRREIDPIPDRTADPMVVADREDALLDWMDERDVVDAWRIAPTLAAVGVELEWCERLEELLDERTLAPGLAWVASTVSCTGLLEEITESTRRVSSLVEDVRSYSQLDRAAVQEIDVTEGIESTLVMLTSRIGTGVVIERDYADDVPRIEAIPGELNQVWTNLISNAVDAMDANGTLRLTVRAAGDAGVVVEVADTGAGMPVDVQARAFEPFFTTKDVGSGTGLGLDISRRIIVDRHRGDITIESVPGDTVMRVELPLRHD